MADLKELHVFVVRHLASSETVEAHAAEHIAYLQRYHAEGIFLASGQLLDQAEGGIILAHGVSRARAEQISAEDPFVQRELSRHEISTFRVRRAPAELLALL